jgi:hypothetical protein
MKSLPILNLDDLSIAKPCHAVWEKMAPIDGGEQARHCGSCDKNVYRIAAMSRAEATALIMKHEGRVCLRIARRSDGTVITNDCPVGVATWRKHIAKVSALAAAALGVLFTFGVQLLRTGEVMGGITPRPELMGAPMPIEPMTPITPAIDVPELMGEPPMVEPTKPRRQSRPKVKHPQEKMGEVMGDVAMPMEGAAS